VGKTNVSGWKAPEIDGTWKQYSGPECLQLFPVTFSSFVQEKLGSWPKITEKI
jgi:hypothetical protein